MNYEEEQRNEIEALESIYCSEMTILATEPHHSFQLSLSSQDTRHDNENASCTVKFTYNAKYPDEAPDIEITDSENLSDKHLELLEEHMKEVANENLGMVVVFTIVSSVLEKLNEIVEMVVEERAMEKERAEKEVEEAERKKFEGTRVTVETFMSWKARFEAEMAEIKRQKLKAVEEAGPKKLTGKELFMTDHAMDDSDVKFLEEGGEVVEVDESLFQDIDDLTLEEGLDGDDAEFSSVIGQNNDEGDDD